MESMLYLEYLDKINNRGNLNIFNDKKDKNENKINNNINNNNMPVEDENEIDIEE